MPPQPPPPPRQCKVLDVDWCNHSYGKELEDLFPHELVGGDWEEHVYACEDTPWAGEHTTMLFMYRTAVIGDVDLDGHDDVVVAIDEHWYGCGDQGSYWVTHLIAFRVADGVVTPLASTTGNRFGDWELTVENGQLRRSHPGPCVERWAFALDKLEQVGTGCVKR